MRCTGGKSSGALTRTRSSLDVGSVGNPLGSTSRLMGIQASVLVVSFYLDFPMYPQKNVKLQILYLPSLADEAQNASFTSFLHRIEHFALAEVSYVTLRLLQRFAQMRNEHLESVVKHNVSLNSSPYPEVNDVVLHTTAVL